MNKRIKNSVAVFLSVIILVSSTGVVLAAHNCFSKAETEVSLFRHKGCCSNEKKDCHSKPQKENSFTKKCCQLKITYHKIDVSSPLVKFSSVSDLKLLPVKQISFSPIIFSTDISSCFLNKAPPFIRAGVSLLHSIHTLQI